MEDFNQMMEQKTTILNYLLERKAALSYYQFDRKLSNDQLHEMIPNLRNNLNELIEDGKIAMELVNGIELYFITELGKWELER